MDKKEVKMLEREFIGMLIKNQIKHQNNINKITIKDQIKLFKN